MGEFYSTGWDKPTHLRDKHHCSLTRYTVRPDGHYIAPLADHQP